VSIALRNRSSAECALAAKPVVTLFGKTNRQLAVQFCPNCIGYLFDKQPVQRVLLKPNETAYLVLGYDIDDGTANCKYALTIGLRLAKDAAPLKVDVAQAGRAMRSCGRIDVTPFLNKPPVDGVLTRRDPEHRKGRITESPFSSHNNLSLIKKALAHQPISSGVHSAHG
jgi:hypothetical protein